MIKKKIGVIAGAGELPIIAIEEIIARGDDSVVISVVENLLLPEEAIRVGLSDMSLIIDELHQQQVKEIIFIGKVDKRLLFGLNPDDRARRMLSGLIAMDDASLMLAITQELEREGVKVAKQTDYLGRFIPSQGVLSQKKPDNKQQEDIDYGFNLAKKVADLFIGQTIVVKDKMVMAVEAIEGTDEAIIRGARLASGGAVVIKVSSTNHDLRFDVPTVGKETISSMVKSGASVLAVEAGRTFLVKGVIEEADMNGLVVMAV
ncbi:LpxI family protein [Candidatus Desantisbacteria bacterium]|nr:LpxI family protein [Candidatus Desantisbacteria bacterium]